MIRSGNYQERWRLEAENATRRMKLASQEKQAVGRRLAGENREGGSRKSGVHGAALQCWSPAKKAGKGSRRAGQQLTAYI